MSEPLITAMKRDIVDAEGTIRQILNRIEDEYGVAIEELNVDRVYNIGNVLSTLRGVRIKVIVNE